MPFVFTKTKELTLILTYEEAQWLNAVMQNPLHDVENTRDGYMRSRFFNATKDAQI